MTTGDALVIGIGNPLRGDDAVGRCAVETLAAASGLNGLRTLSVHQLLPEHALDVSNASVVILIDAQVNAPPGTLSVRRVTPHAGTASAWSHRLDPVQLVSMAWDLYDATPDVYTIGVGVQAIEPGVGLSRPCEAALPAVMATVAEILGQGRLPGKSQAHA